MISDNKCKVMVYVNKELNKQVEQISKELGISKSALFQLAMVEYIVTRIKRLDL